MTDGAPYPRDLVGYGSTPPKADWPGGARVAVQFVIFCKIPRRHR